ncbi:hypothetical protein BH23CHL1_BH23CHL1_15960 [soil metagenome]
MVNEREASYRVVVEVGNEYFPPGRTSVEAISDGQVRVVTRLEGEESQTDGRFDPSEIEQRVADITAGHIDPQQDERRRGLPDEPRYRLLIYRGSERVLDIEMWRSSLPDNPSIEKLVAALNGVVYEVSGGEAIL